MLALLSPKESKKKDHPLSPKSARAGARAAARAATPHTHCAALSKSLSTSPVTAHSHTPGRGTATGAGRTGRTPRGRGARPGAIYIENFATPCSLGSRAPWSLAGGWAKALAPF